MAESLFNRVASCTTASVSRGRNKINQRINEKLICNAELRVSVFCFTAKNFKNLVRTLYKLCSLDAKIIEKRKFQLYEKN